MKTTEVRVKENDADGRDYGGANAGVFFDGYR